MIQSKEMIDQVDNFTYLDSVTIKNGRRSKDVKSRTAKIQESFSHLQKVWENMIISLQNKIRS